ncbi:MAG: AAA family ATPase [Candidatus Eremiobacteraeota bacterium]|nr:AAA family ATPase [Candidatus Eremiobacteraeota bacterium]
MPAFTPAADSAQVGQSPAPTPPDPPAQQLLNLANKLVEAGLASQIMGALGAALSQTVTSAPTFPTFSSQGYTLDSVGGLEEPKAQLNQALTSFDQGRAWPTPGFLVFGWSQSGKTHLLRGFAGECEKRQIPVIDAPAGEFGLKNPVDGAGNGVDRLSNLFRHAREKAASNPSHTAAIVMEDLDALFPIRDASHPESAAMLSRFSQEMDRVAQDKDLHILVLGTTSRKDTLDVTAINKLGREVFVKNPQNSDERFDILNKLVTNQHWQLATPEDSLRELADSTAGRTIGELRSIMTRASEKATGPSITGQDINQAKLDHFYGPAQAAKTPDWFFRLSVAHEVGHAVIRDFFDRLALEDQQPWARPQAIDQLVMEARGESSASVSLKYSGNPSKTFEYYFAEIASNYGGRSAEYLFGSKHISAGPGNDIDHITGLAREAVTQVGMGQQTGAINIDKAQPSNTETVDQDIRDLTSVAEKVSMTLVNYYRDFIEHTADEFVTMRNRSGGMVWPAEAFSQAVQDWQATQDPQALVALKDEIRRLRESVKPTMPNVFDPNTGGERPVTDYLTS